MPSNLQKYYLEQAGSGLVGFQGIKYQKGHNLLGRFFSRIIQPAFGYLKNTLLDTGLNIADDVLAGEDLRTSAKNQLKKATRSVAQDLVAKGRAYAQRGSGRRRRRKSTKFVRGKKTRKVKKRRKAYSKSLLRLLEAKKRSGKVIKGKRKRKRRTKVANFDFLK